MWIWLCPKHYHSKIFVDISEHAQGANHHITSGSVRMLCSLQPYGEYPHVS